jgi:Glycosyl hydrolases family 16
MRANAWATPERVDRPAGKGEETVRNRKWALLAAMAAAALIPAASVSDPAAEASSPQPYGAGTNGGPPVGWTIANDQEGGKAILANFKQTGYGPTDCTKRDKGKATVDAAGNLNLAIPGGPTTKCAEVTSKYSVYPQEKIVGGEQLWDPVYIEWRASVPMRAWAGLWLTGGKPWPHNGEIDVMEVLHRAYDLCQTFHYLGQGKHPPHHCKTSRYSANTWHYYGVEWTNDSLTFYYDGTRIWKYGPSSKVTTVGEQVVMDVVNSGWDARGKKANLYISYVRTWQKCLTAC